MSTDPYGIANYTGNSGIYYSLAGGNVPPTSTYTAAANNSSNGVNWSGILDGVGKIANTGANIYGTIANASKKPGETNITLLDPNTGRPVINNPTPYSAGQNAGNNNLLFIVAGVVLVVVIGFFAFFKKGK